LVALGARYYLVNGMLSSMVVCNSKWFYKILGNSKNLPFSLLWRGFKGEANKEK